MGKEKKMPELSRSEYVADQWMVRPPDGYHIELGEHTDQRLVFKLVKK